jgi:1,4-alpha-glucan branching enzyme
MKQAAILFVIVSLWSCAGGQIIPNVVIYNNTCTFTYESASAKSVNLTGDFNSWDTSSLPMKKVDSKTWVLRMHLNKGIYHYQFIINKDKRVVPPYADAYSSDGFGGKNGVLIIGNGS